MEIAGFASRRTLAMMSTGVYGVTMTSQHQDQLARDYESLYRSYVAQSKEVEHLSTLREISLAVNASLDLQETLPTIASVVHGALEVQRLTIFEAKPEDDTAQPVIAKYGDDLISRDRLEEEAVPLRGPLLEAYTNRRNIYENTGLGLRLYIPLLAKTDVFGVMVLERPAHGAPFKQDDDALYASLGAQVGMAIHNARLYALAVTDGLTGLYVRRYFDLRLNEEFELAKRYRRAFSLLLFDIDHFKKFNDTHGHQTGDLVLQQFADLVRKNTRATDICCRYGGEEFGVILPETRQDEAELLANKLCLRVRQAEFRGTHDESLSVTTSIGVATFREDQEKPAAMVEAADGALYAAKEAGRNRVEMAAE